MVRPPALALPSVLLLALLIGCGSGGPPEDEVLASLADLVIVPGYRATATEIARLDDALTALCATPSPSALDHARSAWRDARAPWMRSKATWFGPIMDRRSIGLMDWSPVEPERIEKLLRERPAATQETIRDELSSTQRGFGAVRISAVRRRRAGTPLRSVLSEMRLCGSAGPLAPLRVRGNTGGLGRWK